MVDGNVGEFTMPDLSGGDLSEHDVVGKLSGILNPKRVRQKAAETPDPEAEPAEEESETPDEEHESEEGEEGESEEGAAEEGAETEDDEEPDTKPAADLHKVKVDGKEIEVTLDDLKKSYSFEKHLTQKSQKVAEKEKYLDGEYHATQAERARYNEMLGQLEAALDSLAPDVPDWDKLLKENPIEYTVKRAELEQHRERLANVQAERQQVSKLQQEHAARVTAQQIVEESAKLTAAIPEWADEKVAQEGAQKLVEYAAEKYGYTTEDLAEVTDHRLFVILDKARRWDAREKAKPLIQKRAAEVVKTAKPGPAALGDRKASGVQRLQKRAERTGDVEDIANLILAKKLI